MPTSWRFSLLCFPAPFDRLRANGPHPNLPPLAGEGTWGVQTGHIGYTKPGTWVTLEAAAEAAGKEEPCCPGWRRPPNGNESGWCTWWKRGSGRCGRLRRPAGSAGRRPTSGCGGTGRRGAAGLLPGSRAPPPAPPHATPEAVAAAIIAAKERYPDWGPKKLIAWLLGARTPATPWARAQHRPGPCWTGPVLVARRRRRRRATPLRR